MKKLYFTLASSILAYFLIDFQRQKLDRLCRYAAGESLYEKTHHQIK